jgi:phospholipid/cholesterol/gamma-HCH transport system substrate-binding protein
MFSNETKIGLLVIIASALMIWGYKFVKGKNILGSSTYLYVQYDEIDQLATSTPVTIQGFQVGIVSHIEFKNVNDKQVVEVELDIQKGIKIPKTATASIVSTGLMGGKAVVIEFDKPCEGDRCAKSGDMLEGRFKSVLASMMSTDDLGNYMDEVQLGVGPIVDSLKNKIGGSAEGQQSMQDIQVIIANLKSVTGSLDVLMRKSSGKIDGLLGNLESITNTINASQSDIKGIISNASAFSTKINNLELDKTLEKANKAIDSTPALMDKLQGTLAEADKAAQELSSLMIKMNSGDGTLGKLMNQDDLYNNLEKAVRNMDLLMEDIRLHPERYRRILSKKKMPYQEPETN